MREYRRIISAILILFMICISDSAVFALPLAVDTDNLAVDADRVSADGIIADLNGKYGDPVTRCEGEIKSSYHQGKFMETEEKEAVLAAMNDEKHSQVINDLYNGIKAYQESIPLERYSINPSELLVCYTAVINNHPDMYYVSMLYDYTIFEDGEIAEFYPTYLLTRDEMVETQNEIDNEVDKILAEIEPGMSRMDQITAVTNYFTDNYTYDYEHYQNPGKYEKHYKITALFMDKTAVCEGFGLGFQYVMEKINIPCVTVQSPSMGHLWNLVQAKEGSENWYHIDSTWNAQWGGDNKINPYIFFMKSDNGMKIVDYGGTLYEHYDYSPDGWAKDENYDHLPLSNITGSSAIYANGKWYYGKGTYDWMLPGTIKSFDFSTGKEKDEVTLTDSWTLEGYNGWTYPGYYFSNAVIYNDKIYYNDESNIYIFDPVTGKSTIFKANPEGVVKNSKCIYALRLEGNQLIYVTAGAYPAEDVPSTEHIITLSSSRQGNMLEVKDGTANVTLTDIEGANEICFAFFDADGRFISSIMAAHDGSVEASISNKIPSGAAKLSVFAVDKNGSKLKPIGTSVHKSIN